MVYLFSVFPSMMLPTLECVVKTLDSIGVQCDFEEMLYRIFGQDTTESNDRNIVDLLPAEYSGCAGMWLFSFFVEPDCCKGDSCHNDSLVYVYASVSVCVRRNFSRP